MVTVSNYAVKQNSEGKNFVALYLQGDIELVKSSVTGNYYATAKRCVITSTFDEVTASMLIGKQIPGSIQKVACDAYDYVVQETGEKITLQHRYVYSPQEQVVPTASIQNTNYIQPMHFTTGTMPVTMGEA